jgi:hypothetical protein
MSCSVEVYITVSSTTVVCFKNQLKSPFKRNFSRKKQHLADLSVPNRIIGVVGGFHKPSLHKLAGI